jgi:hypothetical protein
MIGAITFIIALIYVPRCKVAIYADNANALGLGMAGVMTYLAYRFK